MAGLIELNVWQIIFNITNTIILFIAYMIDHVLQRRLKNGH